MDLVMLGPDKKVFDNDSTRNESYYGYGADVYAVADGIVGEIQNDVTENIPPNMTVPRTAKNITGNYQVLQIKGGKSVYYGHLMFGSILVKPGDYVRRGQLLAKVGNTGNSTSAHLHFQMQDGPLFSNEGYPFSFSSILKYGSATKRQIDDIADRGEAYPGTFDAKELKNKLPVYGDIIMFE